MPAMAGEVGGGGDVKVFWFFSSEKNLLPYLRLGTRGQAAAPRQEERPLCQLLGIIQRRRRPTVRLVGAMVGRHETPALSLGQPNGRPDEYAVYLDDLGCLHDVPSTLVSPAPGRRHTP